MTNPKKPRQSEAEEQAAVIQYCELRRIPIFHIPNGGSRNKAEAAHLKAQGVKPGVPDLFLPVAKQPYHGLFIEMKAEHGRISDHQKEWLTLLSHQGYAIAVCYGFDQAKSVIDSYLHLPSWDKAQKGEQHEPKVINRQIACQKFKSRKNSVCQEPVDFDETKSSKR